MWAEERHLFLQERNAEYFQQQYANIRQQTPAAVPEMELRLGEDSIERAQYTEHTH
jgi:hypothetical protein